MAATTLLSFENPVFSYYAFYSVLALLKMFFLALLTPHVRGKYQVFGTEEDIAMFAKKKDIKVNRNHPDVERVRGNHLNDLENIPAFILLGLLYVLVQPSPLVALWHFRLFVMARVLHTVSYQCAIRQPARSTTYMIGLFLNISMAVQVLLYAPYW